MASVCIILMVIFCTSVHYNLYFVLQTLIKCYFHKIRLAGIFTRRINMIVHIYNSHTKWL